MGEYNRTAHLQSEICVVVQSCTRATLFQKQTNGFVQHLEPQACVRNDSVVFSPHMRRVKKKLSVAPAALIFSGCPNQEIG
jgi:hypothetical protein